MEVLVALALFAMLLTVTLPAVLQSARNQNLAEERYTHQLAAQAVMLAVRDAAIAGECVRDAAQSIPLYEIWYGVWVFNGSEYIFYYPQAPHTSISITTAIPYGIVVVAVFNEYGEMAGRAVGVLI